MKRLSDDLESFGWRLSLGAVEVDRFLTEDEIETLETIAARYAGRRSQLITEDERNSNHGS